MISGQQPVLGLTLERDAIGGVTDTLRDLLRQAGVAGTPVSRETDDSGDSDG